MFKAAFPQTIQDFSDTSWKIIIFKESEALMTFYPYVTLCKWQFSRSICPNKATKPFFSQQQVTSVIDNWNMYDEDVM